MTKCEYGCGQEATYYKFPTYKLPTGRYSCDVSPNRCPAKRKKTSGDNNPSKRSDVREKISEINSVLFASGSPLRQKCQSSLELNHGVKNPMFSHDIVKKVVETRKEKDNYYFDPKLCWTKEARIKRKKTRIEKGLDLDPQLLNDFIKYEKIVDYLTEKSYQNFRLQINPSSLKRGRTSGSFQLDHIFSKRDGFTFGILPYYIAHPANLRMLTIEENISKNSKSDMSVTELFKAISHFNQL